MHNLFVIGVSGALGSRVLPALAADPSVAKIVGLDRAPLLASAPKLEFVQGRLADIDLAPLLKDIEVVVHLSMSSGTTAVRKLLEACCEAGVKHLVVLSSAATYGAWPTNSVPLAEDAPLRPNSGFPYAVNLAERERLVVEWSANQKNTTVAILRLAMVIGGGFDKALTQVLGGVQAHRHESSRPVQFLHIDDAVSAVVLAVSKHLNGTYNVAPKGFIGDAMAREVAGAPRRPALPKRVAYLANDFTWRRNYSSAFSDAEPYLVHPWVVSSDRLQAEGWEPTYTNEEALIAEAKPTWWGRLKPGQRRAIVTGSIVGSSVGGVAGTTAAVVKAVRKRKAD